MKDKCDKCGVTYNITNSPNKIEGVFVTQEVWDVRQSDLLDEIMKEDGNKPIYCQKCPSCDYIKPINEDELKDSNKKLLVDFCEYLQTYGTWQFENIETTVAQYFIYLNKK